MNGYPIPNTTGCVDPYACGLVSIIGGDEMELRCKYAIIK